MNIQELRAELVVELKALASKLKTAESYVIEEADVLIQSIREKLITLEGLKDSIIQEIKKLKKSDVPDTKAIDLLDEQKRKVVSEIKQHKTLLSPLEEIHSSNKASNSTGKSVAIKAPVVGGGVH